MNISKENLTEIKTFCCRMLTQFNYVPVRAIIYWINIEKN